MGGKGKFYIQNVQPGVSTTDQRVEGCKKAIDATNGAVKLIGMDYNDDNAAKAAEQTSAVLAANPDLGGIFGTNLFSAQGAAQAVANAGLTGVVKIANFDAPPDAIKALQENVVDIVIAQHPYEMGQKCIEYAVAAVNGETDKIDKRWPTGYTSSPARTWTPKKPSSPSTRASNSVLYAGQPTAGCPVPCAAIHPDSFSPRGAPRSHHTRTA